VSTTDKNRPVQIPKKVEYKGFVPPLFDRLAAQGAVLACPAACPFPVVFLPDENNLGGTTIPRQSAKMAFDQGPEHVNDPPTLAAIRNEHLAIRNGVGIFDFTMLCKFEVTGPGALALVNQISTNEMDVRIGKVVYTAWCGDDGRFLADGTVARIALDHFRLVGTDIAIESIRELLQHGRAEVLKRDPSATVEILDRTENLSIINIQGPASRRLLEFLTTTDLSRRAFPFMSRQRFEVAGVDVDGWRVSFAGELGWELFVENRDALHVYDACFLAGAELGVVPCGIEAIYSLASEKGLLDFGYTIDESMTPLEANMGAFIAWEKPDGFRGRAALSEQRDCGATYRAVVLVKIGREPMVIDGGTPILRNGIPTGSISMCTYGPTVGANLGYAYVEHSEGVTDAWIREGDWTVAPNSKGSLSAEVGRTPWFDPTRSRTRV
jgi:glycine cleavage system aminomethyltransferase T